MKIRAVTKVSLEVTHVYCELSRIHILLTDIVVS